MTRRTPVGQLQPGERVVEIGCGTGLDRLIAAKMADPNGLQASGFAPLGELVQKFLSSGGRLWACGSCTRPRGITQEQLIEVAQTFGAATIVEAIVNGAQTLSE